jgi:hypothetical protein
MDLDEWIRNKTGTASIDADFFTHEEERRLTARVEDYVAQQLAAGARIAFRDEHVDLVQLVSDPVDFILNFDYHMDCRIEFLHGDEPMTPPCNASLFETLLSSGSTEKYIWAFPSTRRRQAALAYSSAFVAGRQPRMHRIHCVSGAYAIDRLLGRATIASIFVCRSPEYATADTDAVYERLSSLVGHSPPGDSAAR